MTRVKSNVASRARRKKILKKAEGYFGSKHRLYRTAKEQLMHSERYAYRDRKQKKRDFRKLWITRINAGCRENGISYSRFINGLSIAGVDINRKMLSELAISDKATFASLVEISKAGKVINKPVVKKEIKEQEVKEVTVEKENNKSLESMTVAELKELAKEKNIDKYTTMKKAELIAALK